jgi:hypothetical protein
MAWKAVIDKIEPIGEIEIGTWERKEDAEKEAHLELGLHWERYMKDVEVSIKLKEVV